MVFLKVACVGQRKTPRSSVSGPTCRSCCVRSLAVKAATCSCAIRSSTLICPGSRYRDLAASLLEQDGALVEPLDAEGLEDMLPASAQHTLHAPELVRLGFGADLPPQAQRVRLESAWLDRFGHLLDERGRWLP